MNVNIFDFVYAFILITHIFANNNKKTTTKSRSFQYLICHLDLSLVCFLFYLCARIFAILIGSAFTRIWGRRTEQKRKEVNFSLVLITAKGRIHGQIASVFTFILFCVYFFLFGNSSSKITSYFSCKIRVAIVVVVVVVVRHVY